MGQVPLAGNETFFLRFRVPGISSQAPDRVLSFYFCGPAQSGIGQYAITFGGDGYAELREREEDGSWSFASRMAYCSPHQVCGPTHLVQISPSLFVLNPKLSGVILFEFTQAQEPSAQVTALGTFVPNASESKQTVFHVAANSLTVQPAPLRIDIRRDLRVWFQVSTATYATAGEIRDDLFSCSFLSIGCAAFPTGMVRRCAKWMHSTRATTRCGKRGGTCLRWIARWLSALRT